MCVCVNRGDLVYKNNNVTSSVIVPRRNTKFSENNIHFPCNHRIYRLYFSFYFLYRHVVLNLI